MNVEAGLALSAVITEALRFVATLMFVGALRMLGNPVSARRGLRLAGLALLVLLASVVTQPDLPARHLALIGVAMLLGAAFGFRRSMTLDLSAAPRMVAMLNTCGAMAATAVAVFVLMQARYSTFDARVFALLGCFVGCTAFAGSLYAWLRLGGRISRKTRFVRFQRLYLASAVAVLILGLLIAFSPKAASVLLPLFVLLALAFGVLMTMPTAATDLPVLISIYNAFAGLAVAFDGYVLQNPVMMVVGMLVFTAGAVLTRLMARSQNRRLSEIMYSGFSETRHRDYLEREREQRHFHRIDPHDAAYDLAYASRVLVVPGYGMALAQAHHKIRELTQLLDERGVDTAFAIHPVAGRMPGHMNILLAEAGVPYDAIHDIDDINHGFPAVDVVLVVGANDTVNPGAREDPSSPLHGMAVLDVARARRVIVLKRGGGLGYAGVENPLFLEPHVRVMPGDAAQSVQSMILHLKDIG
ncbi:MAG: NAD(P) transhydrogenase subunit beta [Gammaproteobacteria bacterium]|nr:MAG: NAD(P) transhydrogenase subunit beta [Gammaproteobacteria bacterium]